MKPEPASLQLPGLEATKASKPRTTAGELGMSAEEYRRRVALIPRGLKALSIRQPWAWLITRPDLVGEARIEAYARDQIKTFENRDWSAHNSGRKFRGTFLVHASKGCTKAEYKDACSFARHCGVTNIPSLEKLERGGIVGTAEVRSYACSETDDDDSYDGPWRVGDGLVLAFAEPLPFVPCGGMLGFFNPVFPEVMTTEGAR